MARWQEPITQLFINNGRPNPPQTPTHPVPLVPRVHFVTSLRSALPEPLRSVSAMSEG